MTASKLRLSSIVLIAVLAAVGAKAQVASAPPAPQEPALFAVEIKTGPKWDSAKQAHEQVQFREHSANLKKMRESGALVMGARYSDKGLLVVSAPSAGEVEAMLDQDPSFAAGTFVYEVHPFSVFYPGEIKARGRR